MSESKELFTSFRPVSKAEWIKKIEEDLKGKAYESLFRQTPEGLLLEPVHHRDDRKGKSNFRFSAENRPWIKRQNFHFENTAAALSKMNALAGSAFEAIGFHFDRAARVEDPGPLFKEASRLNLSLHLESDSTQLKEVLLNWANSEPGLAAKAKGSIGGGAIFPGAPDPGLRRAMPGMKQLLVNDLYNEPAPDNLIIDISLTLKKLNALLQHASRAGWSGDEIVEDLIIQLVAGPDFFRELARLRALRMLAANLLLLHHPNTKHPDGFLLHAVVRAGAEEDAYRGLLKGGTTALAALAGTADMLSIDSSTRSAELSTDEIQRLSRNIQLLFAYEVKATRVADPYRGSYYVETLSEKMAEAAWAHFTQSSEI